MGRNYMGSSLPPGGGLRPRTIFINLAVYRANMDHCGTCSVEVKKEMKNRAPSKVSDTPNQNHEIANKSRHF